MTIKGLWQILKQTFKEFADLKITRMSAALAYYTVFSIAPMLIVIITLCDIFLGREAIEGQVFEQIRSFVGDSAALQIQELIKNATISKDISWASVVGIIALIFAATSVFAEIQDSINLIWRLKAKPRKGWLKLLINRVLSFSMVVSLGFILLVSLVVNAALNLLEDHLLSMFPGMQIYIAYALNILLQFITISFLFGTIFKVLPDAKIHWKNVRSGAFTTALLFMLGKFAVSYYLGKSHISSSYGAAGSLVIILLWVYYSAIILYFGAAFTRVYAQHTGNHIFPTSYAVFIQEIEVENKHALDEQSPEVKTIVKEDEIIIKHEDEKENI
ncbi:YihY/virulence factor BrkB family protein [Panacibacter ginsenosidivorans]|uniref:YihY/virulence factor BrkB family protein n=1 Tax=Panacibacter ginsenosidivorans TaxID=1813871 RepID=A0A5B8VD55_9BACT|nr:YihY/virulence factor BrkB family protein [Panacibacter ginsenosidivorans]QEC69394.1 YihY/virulence factor BrkB family protein [Panacibacter ginsenosidivorans]